MNTDQLIDRLVADIRPVKRLLDPTTRAALWTSVALVSIGAGLVYFGIRRDIVAVSTNVEFLTRVGLLLATMWLSVVASFRLAVPGYEQRAFARWWPVAALGVLLAITVSQVVAAALVGDLGSPMRAAHCIQKVTFVGVVPAIVSVVLVRRGWTSEPRWTLLLGMLAAGAAGGITAEVACPLRAPLHIVLWHVLPVVGVAALGVVLGEIVLSHVRRHH